MEPRLEELESTFKALADKTRLRILGLLLTGEVCVCHIHDALRIPQPKTSRHLAYLRRAGLVEARKDGLWVHYRLSEPADALLRTVLSSVTHSLTHLPTTAKDQHRLEQATGTRKRAPRVLPVVACCAPRV